MRILLVTHVSHSLDPNRYTYGLIKHLARCSDLAMAEWERMDSPSVRSAATVAKVDLGSIDLCLMYMRFRLLMLRPFDWSGFDGPKVWMEHDAWQSYSPAHREWNGRYPHVYHRDGFDLMISTGKDTTARLRADGVNAVWLPKAYDAENFRAETGSRQGVCTFGTAWPSRRALKARLGKGVQDVSGPYATLSQRLNAYAGAIVCNMPGRAPLGRIGGRIQRVLPAFVRVWPAIEPMIKTFEVAGAGCAPIVDYVEELADLGFVDGETCLTYKSFDEAVQIVSGTDSKVLERIGRNAEELVRECHTWRHRGEALPSVIEAGLKSKSVHGANS